MRLGPAWAWAPALLFGAVAARGLLTGKFRSNGYRIGPYIRRNERPFYFWSYAIGLIAAALVCAAITISAWI